VSITPGLAKHVHATFLVLETSSLVQDRSSLQPVINNHSSKFKEWKRKCWNQKTCGLF